MAFTLGGWSPRFKSDKIGKAWDGNTELMCLIAQGKHIV